MLLGVGVVLAHLRREEAHESQETRRRRRLVVVVTMDPSARARDRSACTGTDDRQALSCCLYTLDNAVCNQLKPENTLGYSSAVARLAPPNKKEIQP